MAAVTITSFGYGHAAAPTAEVTLDVRRNLRDPLHQPALRNSTGLDPAVRRHVMTTPGAHRLVATATQVVLGLLADTSQPVTIAVGCRGGRHRSVALAEEIAAELTIRRVEVAVEHRDVDRPLLAAS